MNRIFIVLTCIFILTGCKADLYTGLSQEDANQMMVILTNAHIESDKVIAKDGSLTLAVDKQDFVRSVELLRQHGFPHKNYQSVNDVFPSGQLVTSPMQERVKINYLKEQSLEKMLSDIEGVISARVSIALTSLSSDDRDSSVPASASVFIKYASDVNMEGFVTQIKSLVHNSIPEVNYGGISVVLQPAQNLLPPVAEVTTSSESKLSWKNMLHKGKIQIYGTLAIAWIISLLFIVVDVVRKSRKKKTPGN